MQKTCSTFATSILFITLGSSIAISASAEDTKNTEEELWKGQIELGFVNTSGNTEESSIKSLAEFDRESEKWRYNIHLDSLNTESDDNRTAEKYFASNRLAFQYNEYDYSFFYASYDDDRFTGFDYQATAAIGYGRRLLNDDIRQLDVEIGPGYRESKVEDDSSAEDSQEFIFRAAADYSWQVSETAKFTQTANVESGEDNTISKAVSALQVQINGHLSMKLSYTIKYTEEVPTENKHADTETAVTFAYSF